MFCEHKQLNTASKHTHMGTLMFIITGDGDTKPVLVQFTA